MFEILEQRFVLPTQEILSVPVGLLKRPVASLAAERDRVARTLDVLLLGF